VRTPSEYGAPPKVAAVSRWLRLPNGSNRASDCMVRLNCFRNDLPSAKAAARCRKQSRDMRPAACTGQFCEALKYVGLTY